MCIKRTLQNSQWPITSSVSCFWLLISHLLPPLPRKDYRNDQATRAPMPYQFANSQILPIFPTMFLVSPQPRNNSAWSKEKWCRHMDGEAVFGWRPVVRCWGVRQLQCSRQVTGLGYAGRGNSVAGVGVFVNGCLGMVYVYTMRWRRCWAQETDK